MSEIKVKVIDQSMIFTNAPVIASGGVSEDRVVFEFADTTWDGYTKTAMFFNNKNEGYAALMTNDVATVPAEAMASEGYMSFGLIGVKGDARRTSEVLRCNIVRGANTVITPAPNLDIYTQILNAISGTVIPEEVREQRSWGTIKFWAGTQAEYDALTPVDGVMYFITDGNADYVISTGTTGAWNWRKWANGRLEMSKRYEITNITFASQAPLYRTSMLTSALPSGMFVDAPVATVNTEDIYYWVGGVSANTTGVNYCVYAVNDPEEAQDFYVDISVVGAWK